MKGNHSHSRACLVTLVLALAGGMVAPSASAALTYVFESSNPLNVPSVLDAGVTGVEMRDMEVTILRTDGETDTRIWGASTAGRAIGVGWSLNLGNGNTDSDAWGFANSLSHAPVHQIVLRGKPGRVMFDVDMYDVAFGNLCSQYAASGGSSQVCSSGSGQGRRFEYEVGKFDATVTYSDPVGLAGVAPVGDLFYTMTIEFARPGMDAGFFSFFQDTDIAARSAVPVPAASLLMGTGVISLLGLAGRRRKVPQS